MPVETDSSSNAIQRLQLDQTADGVIRLKVCLPAGSKITLAVDVTTPDDDILASHTLTLKNPPSSRISPTSAPYVAERPALPAQPVLIEQNFHTESYSKKNRGLFSLLHLPSAARFKQLGASIQNEVKDDLSSLKNLPQSIILQIKSLRFSPREWISSSMAAFQPGWQF
ncbi:MAG: hypothetical protein LWX83_11000, partial [Anaerolineae bacterium]|nr:hypothetical protein [Anaerolineae bacterium]